MVDIGRIIREASSRSTRLTDHMRYEEFRARMSEQEKIAGEESLRAYSEHIELYNVLKNRAIEKPWFLQRNLNYKIEANHQRRIKMTMNLSSRIDAAGADVRNQKPLYIMLARLVSPKATAEDSAVYKFKRTCIQTGVDGTIEGNADFLLPRMDKLAFEAKSGSLAILFISFAGAQNSQFGIGSSKIPSVNIEGHCLWNKIPLEELYSSWQNYPNMDLGEKANTHSLLKLQPGFIKLNSTSEEGKCVMIQVPSNPLTSMSPQEVHVTISAEEVGPTEKSPYSSFSFDDIPSPSMLPMIRVRAGNVVFNYRYYNNNLQKTEVTEDFMCSICLIKCASFKGLQCHMPSAHDLFNFEFWVNEEFQAVNVSLKSETMIPFKINEDDLNERKEPYFFFSKKSRRKRQKSQVGNSMLGPLLEQTDDNFGSSVQLSNCKCSSSSESHT